MKKFIRFFLLHLLIGAIMVTVLSVKLNAQSVENSEGEVKDSIILKTSKQLPILNNFRFIPSDIVGNPFITTFIKTSVGAGAAIDLKSFIKDLNGNIIDTLSGNLFFVLGDIQFQLAINDWLALNGKYGGIARLGSNAYTLLTSGISYGAGYSLGAKIKIWENDKMMLSGSIDYNSSQVALYSIYDFLLRVIDEGAIDDSARAKLLEKDNITSMFANINYAYAPTRWLGILANLGWGLGNAFNGKDKGNARIGLAASVDFANVDFVEFPIGVLVSAKYNSFSESGENATDLLTLGLRIGYTGHKDFDVGIENTYQSLNFRLSDEKIKTILIALKIRYYF